MIPDYISSVIKRWFDFPSKETYCQVSTVMNCIPHIRTMRLYDINASGKLVLLTNTRTRKWTQVRNSPEVALCFVNYDFGQIVVEGEAVTKTIANDKNEIVTMWGKLLPYWQDYYLSQDTDQTFQRNEFKIPETFGQISVIPNLFVIVEINKEDYLKSITHRFTRDINLEWKLN